MKLFKEITDFILKRAISIIDELSFLETIYFQFDEPGFCNLKDSFSYEAFSYFFKRLEAIKSPKVKLGIHCCSNTNWDELLKKDLNFISFDYSISLENILKSKNLKRFLKKSKLFLGIIPTNPEIDINDVDTNLLISELVKTTNKHLDKSTKALFYNSLIFTPACGISYKKISETLTYLEKLQETKSKMLNAL